MQNSTYNPMNIQDFDKARLITDAHSASATCTAGTSSNIDLTLTDDYLLTGVQILAKGQVFGDTVTLRVMSGDVTVAQFATNIGIPDDETVVFREEATYPAKIIAGLVLRLVYNSTGEADVKVVVNYKLHKILI